MDDVLTSQKTRDTGTVPFSDQTVAGLVRVLVFGRNARFKPDAHEGEALFTYFFYRIVPDGITDVRHADCRTSNRVVLRKDEEFPQQVSWQPKILRYGVDADGIVVPPGSMGILATGDCPVTILIFLFEDGSTMIMMLHTGREALHPFDRDLKRRTEDDSIITTAFRLAKESGTKIVGVKAAIVCGIAAKSFENRYNYRGKKGYNSHIIGHFLGAYGKRVFEGPTRRGQFNLGTIVEAQIRCEANMLGISSSEVCVMKDEVNTAEDERLASVRRGNALGKKEQYRNLIGVINVGRSS